MSEAVKKLDPDSTRDNPIKPEPGTASPPRTQPVLVAWRPHPGVLARLEYTIWAAQAWDDLARATAAVDAAYQEGAISQEVAETLARWAATTSRRLPEVAGAGETIWAEDLISAPEGQHCPCCGRSAWWYQAEQRICGVCHPHPGLTNENRAAA